MSDDDRKMCAQTIVFQVKAANGHWINWKAASRSPDEEWDMDAVNKMAPEHRFVMDPVEEDPDDHIDDEHDDLSLKRPAISEETRRERLRAAILDVASVAPDRRRCCLIAHDCVATVMGYQSRTSIVSTQDTTQNTRRPQLAGCARTVAMIPQIVLCKEVSNGW